MKFFPVACLFSTLPFGALLAQGDLGETPQWIGPETGLTILADWTANEVLSQGATGTCWSYSTTSFLESEAFRITGELHDFSEMASVRVNYPRKVATYLRYQGHHQFSPGALSHDVLNAVEAYGLLPAEAFDGQPDAAGRHDHSELDGVMSALAESGLDQIGSLSLRFYEAIESVLDTYLGPLPQSFEYRGNRYTPAEFSDAVGIHPGDYVELTSFTHHPVHSSFVLEVPDNFSNGAYFNLTLDELVEATWSALESGYTVAWDADVSNPGFSFKRGVAFAVEEEIDGSGWSWDAPAPTEIEASEASRQRAYDALSTTDDHLMHLVGIAERTVDGKRERYFILKNSWGRGNDFGGRQFVSESYFRLYTMGVMLHKDALPSAIKRMLPGSTR